MRFEGICYRAHDPKWSFTPLSGDGAAIHGARFNPKGMPALYLALTIMTAVKEANQGFARKIDPCVLCSYEVVCDDIANLRSDEDRRRHGVDLEELACAWFSDLAVGREPPSWRVVRRLRAAGLAGALVPSFAPGATADDQNLVLWDWGAQPPHQVQVADPHGRLPRNPSSWR